MRPGQPVPGYIDNKVARGFTGHEHLDKTGFIHMNGRVYDPVLGRFLSPDPIVQAPGNSQSWNRYSYVFNNPLSFTDPSGFASARSTYVVAYDRDDCSGNAYYTTRFDANLHAASYSYNGVCYNAKDGIISFGDSSDGGNDSDGIPDRDPRPEPLPIPNPWRPVNNPSPNPIPTPTPEPLDQNPCAQEGIEGERLQQKFKQELRWARTNAIGDANDRQVASGVVIYYEDKWFSESTFKRSEVSTTLPFSYTAYDPNARYLTGSMNDVSLWKGITAIVIAFPDSRRYEPGGKRATAQTLANRGGVPVFFNHRGEEDCVTPQ